MKKPRGGENGKPSASHDGRTSLDLSNVQLFLRFIESESYAFNFNRAGNRHLFHYTDLAGLHGVVREHDLWLTHSRFSNDDREITHGYDIATKVIEEEIASTLPDKKFLEQVRRLLRPKVPEGVYICCFCDKDNLLSQWRAYGANGTGVSIKIDADKFSWATGEDMPLTLGLLRLWKVYYDEEKDQKKMIKQAIKFGRKHTGLGLAKQAQMTVDAIEFFIPTFKNQDFKAESEWRLIFTPQPNCSVLPKFRVSRQILVPYYSLRELLAESSKLIGRPAEDPLERLPIRHVLVGPSPRSNLNVESAEMLLKAYKYVGASVTPSSTPYRGA